MNHRLPMDISAISTPKFNPVILMGNEGRERRQEMETGIPILIHLFRFLKKMGKNRDGKISSNTNKKLLRSTLF